MIRQDIERVVVVWDKTTGDIRIEMLCGGVGCKECHNCPDYDGRDCWAVNRQLEKMVKP